MVSAMPRKPEPKWDDPEESERFLETAKAVEASDSPGDFEKAIKGIMRPRPSARKDAQ